MNYILRPGVIVTSICGEYLLVSSSACSEYCPRISQINEIAADICSELQKGHSIENINEYIEESYEIDEKTNINEMVKRFIEELYQRGYLIKVEENK